MLIAIQNPFRLLIFSCVLISDKMERILKKKISLISFIIYMYMYKENIFFYTEEKMIKSFKLD